MSDSLLVVLSLLGLVAYGAAWGIVGLVQDWWRELRAPVPFELSRRKGRTP